MLNAWEHASGARPPRWWMGAWLNYRKQATVAYVPNSDVRAIMRGKYPYDYVFNYVTIPVASTADARIVTATDFYVLARLAYPSTGAGGGAPQFRAQFYIDLGDGYTPSDRVLNNTAHFGTAINPAWLRKPFFLPAQTPVLCRVQNMSILETLTVQIVLHGVGD